MEKSAFLYLNFTFRIRIRILNADRDPAIWIRIQPDPDPKHCIDEGVVNRQAHKMEDEGIALVQSVWK